ncbi:MAG TPA: hypothetical protein VF590_05990, partial [Isosphaeraceae bacterium]
PTAQDLARPRSIELPAEVLDRYAGQYLLSDEPDAPRATIRREGGRLSVSFPFRPQPLELVPISETEFDLPFTDGRFSFHADDRGHVAGVRFRVGDSERDMKRVAP